MPRLKHASFVDLNAYLLTRCLEIANQRKHPEHQENTIMQIFEEERVSLRPIVLAFDGYVQRFCKVSSTCLITFDRNRYSVECAYAHQSVTVRVYAMHVVIMTKNQVIGEHERQFGRDKTMFNPWHYLPLLERKPGALRNGAPFQELALPKALEKVRQLLMKKQSGDKQCVAVLLAITQHGIEAVNVACELALTEQIISADYIINVLNRLQATEEPEAMSVPLHLTLKNEPMSNCGQYDVLLRGVAAHGLH